MKSIIYILCYLVVVSSSVAVDVVSSFPSPNDYSSGLAWDGNYLWTDGGTYGNIHIYQMDSNGNVISDIIINHPADHISSGLTYDGTNLFAIMSQYFGDPGEICEYTTEGELLSQFTGFGNWCFGLAFDGTDLWISSALDDMIYRSTTSGTLLDSFSSPLASPYDLAFDGSNLWVCSGVWLLEMTTSGSVINAYDLSNIRLGFSGNGLTFDGNNIWITEIHDDIIYQLDVPGIGIESLSLGQIKASFR